jgi:CheY-like chemotaxis protein
VTRAVKLRPDVVLLDIQLPDIDGFDVAEQLDLLLDPPTVVLISSRDAGVFQLRLATTSARGFLAKRRLSGETFGDLVA